MKHVTLKLTALTLALLICLSLPLAALAEDAGPETFSCILFERYMIYLSSQKQKTEALFI